MNDNQNGIPYRRLGRTPLSEGAIAALLKRTAHAGRDGKYELYKTTHHFDGTYQNPQWLG